MPKDTSTASTTPSKNTSSTSGGPSTDSPRSSHGRTAPKDDLEREYKSIDDINPGDVITGPTPGLHKIDSKIDFNLSNGSGDGSAWHPQIVSGKTGDGRLKTVMLTSLGGLDKEMTIWDLWPKRKYTKKEWGKNLRYLVPLEPREVDCNHEEFNQPDVVIKYADNSAQLPKPPWAFVAMQFRVRPLPFKSVDAGKYLVIKGVKISEASVEKLKELVATNGKELKTAKPDPARDSRAGKAEAEQEPAPKPLEKKSTMDKKSAMSKSWRRGDESTQTPHSAGGESTGAPHNNQGRNESTQNAPQSGGGEASKASFNSSGESRTPAHGGGAQWDSSRSFASVLGAPPLPLPPKAREEKKSVSSGMMVFRPRSRQPSQPPPDGNGNPGTSKK